LLDEDVPVVEVGVSFSVWKCFGVNEIFENNSVRVAWKIGSTEKSVLVES
jgi:hypothetical protein